MEEWRKFRDQLSKKYQELNEVHFDPLKCDLNLLPVVNLVLLFNTAIYQISKIK